MTLTEVESTAPAGCEVVDNSEEVARVLFDPDMVDSAGNLTARAFPTDELVRKNGKTVSVNRSSKFDDSHAEIKRRAAVMENPEKGRSAWGYRLGLVESVRQIRDSENQQRIFQVYCDPVEFDGKIDVFHASITKASEGYTRGYVRGFRDHLATAFNKSIQF